MIHQDTFTEKHYTLKEVAEHLKVSHDTARRLVMNEPGVVHVRLGKKKALTKYVVPESVLRRIYNRMVT